MRIWQVNAENLERLQGHDREFAELMNDLLVRHACDGGVPQSSLRLTLNTHAPDGGVDAAVNQAIRAAATGDYCDVPTCWQYRAIASGNLKAPRGKKGGQRAALAHEINNKPEVRRLIGLGYGYRLCIADEITPDQIAEWEGWLNDEAVKIRSDAPQPRVLTASRLATWINRYPGLIRRLRTDLSPFRDLGTYGDEIQYLTKHYHPIADWDDKLRTIREFADFSRTPHRAVLPIRGDAGVGKSRCVYEALASNPANRAVVVYTTSETDGEALANQLAGNPEATALLIADECGQGIAVKMDRSLRAHAKRLRVIAIDNQQQSEQTSIGELSLSRLSSSDVEKILEINYPGIPPDRLRAFAYLSAGFVRLAVDLCDNQHLIPPDGSIQGPLTEFFRRQYLAERLSGDDLTAVLIVSLVTRVGFASDVSEQLGHLCRVCRASAIDAGRIVEIARRLKQSPGFIALGERFLYVTPRLIAQAAFRAAWDRWVGPDPNAFYIELHPDLVEPFLRQLRDAGTDEMRRNCADFFMTWTSSLVDGDLSDDAKVRRLVRLADVEPNAVLPRLRQLIEAIPVDTLKALHGSAGLDPFDLELIERRSRGQAARRELVWLAECFLSLPEHFSDSERILYRLALAETESYGNNASGTWRQIFQVTVSGTPVPYPNRIELLEGRFRDANEESITLLIGAVETCISGFQAGMSRVLGPPIVAGRIPPPDWRPISKEERRACWTATIQFLHRLSQQTTSLVREKALELTIHRLHSLIWLGSLRDAREIVDRNTPLPDVLLSKLLREIDGFLELFCEPASKRVSEAVETELRAWREQLVPDSFHGKLVAVIGEEPWRRWDRGKSGKDPELESIARRLLTNHTELERELPWLLSEEARSAYPLGVRLGEFDSDGILLEPLLAAASKSFYPALGRGYVKALAETHPSQVDRINSVLDHYQRESPKVIADIVSTGCAPLRPLQRLLSMVDEGRVPPVYLRGYAYSSGRELAPQMMEEILRRLIAAAHRGDSDAAGAALDVLGIEYRASRSGGIAFIDAESATRQLIVEVLDLTLGEPGRATHVWNELLEELIKIDSTEGIRIASSALASRDLSIAESAVVRLCKLAAEHPVEVMRRFGDALLDPATGVYLSLRPMRSIVSALPVPVVQEWLEEKGPEGAVAIARHLPEPALVDGAPTVSEITAWVLDRFEQDDRVYDEFCAGTFSRDYSGDIAAQIEQEGEVARPFLGHPSRRIREWTRHQIERSREQAAYWRTRHEEEMLPR